jgi:N-acetylmuramoyl-L-alanine amidase
MKLIIDFIIRTFSLLVWCSLGLLSLSCAAQANQLKAVRAWPSPDSTRVVLDLSNKPDYELHYLTHPDRVVIDLQSTLSKFNLKTLVNDGPLVNNLRESASGQKGTYRLVIDLNQASKAKVFTLPPAAPYGHRLVVDLPHQQLATIPVVKPIKPSTLVGRDIIIAIDAGHGGEDPGAIGKYTYEKNVTLEISKRLQAIINRQKGMSAFLIRTGDYFVNLNKRSVIARKGKADFLVSIHADGFTSSRPDGASVWVLSNRRATTELGRWMEKNEAHSELLGGAGDLIQGSSSVPFLTEMFLDMSMGNAMDVGYHVGDLVVNELKQVTKLHKKKPVHASLAVLKSPDIPSILVEAGFITNRAEERLLNKSSHQNKIANAVFNGIYKHFTEAPPQHTLFAQKKRAIKHTVRSGESLSLLATRYSVTANELRGYNDLKSTALRVGQVIKIPPNYQLVVKQDPVRLVTTRQQKMRIHKVKRGESLSVIAANYGMSSSTLQKYNHLRSTSLAIGQKIKIPGDYVAVAPAPKSDIVITKLPVVHKVKRGESLSVIAGKYDTTTSALKRYNNLRSTSLAIGQTINIPGGGIDIAALSQAPAIIAKPVVHQVKSGESLSVIASKYDTTTSALKRYNNLRSTSLAIGQTINIPGEAIDIAALSQAPAIIAKPVVHQVKSGESLSVIAAKYDTTTSALKRYNNLRSTSLAIGQTINIPGEAIDIAALSQAPAIIAKPVVHQVKSGESLSVIAAKYDTTTSALKRYNNLRSSVLAIGQEINIPGDNIALAAAKENRILTRPASVHRVKSGESLSVIASHYGTTTENLREHNQLRTTSLLIGQRINIPRAGYISPAHVQKADPTVHKVKSGESLSVIASYYGTTTSDLKRYNKMRSSTLLVGQKIKIPTSMGQLTKHKVRSGESLSVIANRYGTTTDLLKSFNQLRSNSLLIGQVLTIPVT